MAKWKLKETGVIYEDEKRVGWVSLFPGEEAEYETMMRNGLLMAAAPEMLTLLRECATMVTPELAEQINEIERMTRYESKTSL